MKTTHLLLLAAVASPVLADSSFNETEQFAYAANAGWIGFRHDAPNAPEGVKFGGAFLSGSAYAANVGWITFGDASPVNGYAYSNDGDDHGVNHDGAGNLSGYAYSANVGWINFGWATPSDTNRPRVNLLNGVFSGLAWSANLGWINLGTGLLTAQSMSDADTDNDGIPDWWEMLHFTNLTTADGTSNADGDGASDLGEFHANTNPEDGGNYLRIVSHSHQPAVTESTLEFTTSPTRLYRIQFSNDLGISDPWTNSALGTFAPDAGATTTRTLSYPGNPRKFFRAVVFVPLSAP